MDYEKLKAEIDGNPALTDFVKTGNDREVADWFNSQPDTRPAPIPMRRVLRWLASSGLLYALEAKADEKLSATASQQEKQISAICKGALRMVQSAHITELDLSDPVITAMVDGLLAAGIMTAAQRTEITALAQEPTTKAITLFGRAVTATDVAIAQGRNG